MPAQLRADNFQSVVLPHLDAAYNLARWLVRDPVVADDVVQDAFLRATKYAATITFSAARRLRRQILSFRQHRTFDCAALDGPQSSDSRTAKSMVPPSGSKTKPSVLLSPSCPFAIRRLFACRDARRETNRPMPP